jgi:predicted permease
MRIVEAFYRRLLRLYPPAFHHRFADEIAEGFTRGLRSRANRRARIRYIASALVDLGRSAIGEWRLLRHQDAAPQERAHLMSNVRRDLRDAVRSLRQRPGFVTAVVLTLALGIGANTAVFTLVDAVLLRPLPIPEPERVVAIFNADRDYPEATYYGLDGGLSYSVFRALEARARIVSPLAGFIDVEVAVDGGRGVRQLTIGAVSGRYFEVLGVQPAAGRLLSAADDRHGAAERVVVLSDAFWAREFARDSGAIGATLRLGGTPFTVAGVAPPRVHGTRLAGQPMLWVPMTTITSLRAGGLWIGPLGERMLDDHPLGWVATIGRLADGATTDRATAELQDLVRAIRAERGEAPKIVGVATPPEREISVRPIVEAASLGDRKSLVRFVAMLSAVVGITLLIACMNVANLIFVRTRDRVHEIAVRRALGASRVRLVAMLFTENLLLTMIGAAAAVAVGIVAFRLLSTFSLPGEIAIDRIGLGLDRRVLGITAGIGLVTALIVGVAPAIRASAPSAHVLLRGRGAGRRRRAPRLLIVGQVALTLVLLVGAGLFIRSLRAGLRTDLGFTPAPLSAVSVDLFRYGYNAARAEPFYREALARAVQLPGVEGVALASHVPLKTMGRLRYNTPDGPYTKERPLLAGLVTASSDYFSVFGMPLVAGRTFSAADSRGRPMVSIINESAARALFGSVSPIGREIQTYGSRPATVIGVVRDSKVESVRDSGVPVVYENFSQQVPTGGVSIVVRSAQPGAILPALRQLLTAIDPGIAVYDARLVAEQVDRALMTQRFGTTLLSLFAVIALVVAAVGIYTVVAVTISQRRSELGIRLALGATPADVLRVVLGHSGVAIVAGALVGVAVAVPAARALERFLFQVEPLDSMSFVAGAGLLLMAAGAAMIVPARRALRTDPLAALRSE